jgi:hypothetical protein
MLSELWENILSGNLGQGTDTELKIGNIVSDP